MTQLPVGVWARFLAVCGGPAQRHLARGATVLSQVAALGRELESLDEEEMRRRSLSLRYRVRSGEKLESLVAETFALVREAARRTLGLKHYDVQIVGGIAIHAGCIAEMEAGEGKTLTATLPCVLHGLTGRGVLVATANDYLARRDAEWMGKVYRAMGLTVGVVETQMPPERRRAAYACDVTYGTAKEFGFDFLRDRLAQREAGAGVLSVASAPGMTGQRRYFALVDEADSLLIDEARTPLIISAAPATDPIDAERYSWAARSSEQFQEGEHFKFRRENDQRLWELTASGRRLVRALPKPAAVETLPLAEIYEFVERAIRVSRDFVRDRQYVVREKADAKGGAGGGGGDGGDEVVIIDEYTGRPGEGRRWREGIHQSIEAKEGVTVTAATRHSAQITVQEFFGLFERIAGMTGTARTSSRELRALYRRRVVPIPTNRPVNRQELPAAVLDTQAEKWTAIVEQVREMHERGRPVLVGTRSIDKSEHLSQLLTAAGISHQVLNARNIPAEAQIVAQAGQAGKVTVATNMAG
ncbi:MAG: preprotein translocase subunit SecA, partial [Planctomycetia bacterium]|nr:preprotein translocase subunit SecA [Planctomycetia bacterium]